MEITASSGERRRSPRVLTAIVVAVGTAVLLTSCFPGAARPTPAPSKPAAAPGLSREAAAELLDAVPGLSSADVGAVISGLSTEVLVEVTVDDESSIRADGVLDYVLRVGWATEAEDAPSQISLTVWNNGTRLDLQDEANALAGVEQEAVPLRYSVHLNPAEFLGAWPGAVPTPPTA